MLQEPIFIINWVSGRFYSWLANIGRAADRGPWLVWRRMLTKSCSVGIYLSCLHSILMTWWEEYNKTGQHLQSPLCSSLWSIIIPRFLSWQIYSLWLSLAGVGQQVIISVRLGLVFRNILLSYWRSGLVIKAERERERDSSGIKLSL